MYFLLICAFKHSFNLLSHASDYRPLAGSNDRAQQRQAPAQRQQSVNRQVWHNQSTGQNEQNRSVNCRDLSLQRGQSAGWQGGACGGAQGGQRNDRPVNQNVRGRGGGARGGHQPRNEQQGHHDKLVNGSSFYCNSFVCFVFCIVLVLHDRNSMNCGNVLIMAY